MAHAGGRPRFTTKDLPADWRQRILEMSAQGLSDVQIRAKFCLKGRGKDVKFNQKTWDAIKDREQEFLLTIQTGRVLCEAWWQDQAQDNLQTKHFQTGLWYANMKNRFGWRDKTEIEGESLKKIANVLQAIRARREGRA